MELMASIPRLIQVLSASTTLRPGDVIATGTPDGVGVGMKPPTFLKPGDLGMLPQVFKLSLFRY